MNELDRETDKFGRQVDQLIGLVERIDEDAPQEHIDIALGLAKRVRRQSTVLVRALARHANER